MVVIAESGQNILRFGRPEGFRQGWKLFRIRSACLARDVEEESHFPASPVSPRASVVDALEFDLTRRDTFSDDTMTESGSDTDRIEFEDWESWSVAGCCHC